MELYIPSSLIWFLAGAACATVMLLAGFATLVYFAGRAKTRRERESREDNP